MSTLGGGSFLDVLLNGYKVVMAAGLKLFPRRNLNFIGAIAIVDNPTLQSTDVFLSTSSGSSGGSSLIIENNGAPLPLEPILNFVGFTVADDPGNTRTNVNVPPAFPPPLALSGTPPALTTAQTSVEYAAGTTIRLPAVPLVGVPILLVHITGRLETSAATIDGNGHNVENPQDRLGAFAVSPAATVPINVSGSVTRVQFNGTLFRCV
jgi:hypothetical protein